jgi:hypothetical protein
MKRQTCWSKVLQVIEKTKKYLPMMCELSGVILQKMFGGKKLLIIWKIHLERSLGNSGIRL